MSEPIEIWTVEATQAPSRLRELLGGREITRSPTGKPEVAGGPHFNLSHSSDLALIAICPDTPVGVDLEAPRTVRNLEGLARRVASGRELDWWADQADQLAAFLRLWVRKEAVAKAEGGGIVTALSGLDVLEPLVQHSSGLWWVQDLPDPRPGWPAAIAWAERA